MLVMCQMFADLFLFGLFWQYSSIQTKYNTHWEELLQSVSNFISANTTDAHPGVSGVSRDQKFCEEFKNTHCQVDHPAKIE